MQVPGYKHHHNKQYGVIYLGKRVPAVDAFFSPRVAIDIWLFLQKEVWPRLRPTESKSDVVMYYSGITVIYTQRSSKSLPESILRPLAHHQHTFLAIIIVFYRRAGPLGYCRLLL
jgi:hypothetical protein